MISRKSMLGVTSTAFGSRNSKSKLAKKATGSWSFFCINGFMFESDLIILRPFGKSAEIATPYLLLQSFIKANIHM